MGRSAQLRKIQIGTESSFGTGVAQTAILPNVTDISITPEVEVVRYRQLSSLSHGVSASIDKVSASAELSGRATYGVAGLWLQSLFGAASDAGASPYTHTWEIDPTSAPTRKFYTLLSTDGTDAVSVYSAVAHTYTLTADLGGQVTESVSFVGETVRDGTATGSLSNFSDSDQHMMPNDVFVYLDDLGSAGTTALGCDALSLEVTMSADTQLIHGLGQQRPCGFITTGFDIQVSLVAQADNSDVKDLVEDLFGTNPDSQISIKDLKVSFGKSASYYLDITMPVRLLSAPTWHTDSDGILTFELDLGVVESSSSSAANGFCDIVLGNDDAVI